ncbi:MAG: hypothetical protein RL607_2144 [Bacteroidota bacterium]
MTRNRLYTIVMIVSISGLFYFIYCYFRDPDTGIGLCLFKNATGYPCPSCGTTRSIKHLYQGEFYKALITNPLGYFMALVMVVVPIWVAYDVLTRNSGFFTFYQKTEAIVRKRPIAIALIGLVLANWIWNIYKQL